jgi:phosphatidylserine decarboxylase
MNFVANEVWPFFFGALVLFGALGICFRLLKLKKTAIGCYLLAVLGAGFMLFFFRNPERVPPADPSVIVAGADGKIMGVKELREDKFLKADAVRISIFLSLFDVHVNRSPVGGKIGFLQYYPGKRYFTFMEKSSDYNQHSSILIEGAQTRCLVNQIVGPVARRVVYWLKPGQTVEKGERIGMMKFGSRLDMYFPKADIEVLVKPGDKVKAGVSPVARLKSLAGGVVK